jgi:beta-barrel assembly-enhancing protease
MTRMRRAVFAILLLLCNHAWSDDGTMLDADRAEAITNKGDRVLNSPGVDAYLTAVVTRLQKYNTDFPASVRIKALKTPLPTIFVLGNGATYVSSGLLEKLENESQLAVLLAAEIATWARRDDLALDEKKRKSAVANSIGSLLLITITAGLASPAIINNQNVQAMRMSDELSHASDIQGLKWAQAAGYNSSEATTVLTGLRATLAAEQRLSSLNGPLANETELKKKSSSLEKAKTFIDAQQNNPAPQAEIEAIDAKQFTKINESLLRWRLAVEIDTPKATAFAAEADRYEARFGETGEVSCLRATYARVSMRNANAEDMNDALARYAKCTSFADAPAHAYRELGFLQRQREDIAAAKLAFKTYLQKVPTAVDAPIIRSYIGEN